MSGSLTPFADAYAAELRRRGYTPLTSVNQLRGVVRLSSWLEANGLSVAELSGDRVEAFLAWQRAGGGHRSQVSRPGLVCLLEVLRELEVLGPESTAAAASPRDLLLESFERHLLGERALAQGTVHGYVMHARWFLDGLASEDALVRLSAGEVTGAVVRKADSGVSVAAAQYFVSGLRAFLRFCYLEGVVAADLSPAALLVRGRRRSSLPKAISRADAKALLAACDRRSPIGRRDYAVVITLLRLGLRRGELARLTLDDIEWRAGELVVRGKGREDRLPLPADVGAAIAAYLKRGRPASDRRELFLRARAPYTPIASGTVASTVRRACRRAGIPEVGSHRLRHTTACEMVQAGVPIVRIGQVLRHQSLQTTAIYARVDVEQLRQLAAPWPTTDDGGAGR
jgi:site-specific recombinase XerD